MNECVFANGVEEFDHIPRSHADATVADREADIPLLRGAVDVDIPPECIAVAGFESLEPEDARDDRVAARCIHGENLAGWNAALENSPRRQAMADLFLDPHFSERGAVGSGSVAEAELRGRDGVGAEGEVVFQDDHALVRGTDDQSVSGLGSTPG